MCWLLCSEEIIEKETIAKPIYWMKLQSANLSQVRRISGVLQAAQSANLSFEVSGKVEKVLVNLGDDIKKGQILTELDKASFILTKKYAESSLQEGKSLQGQPTRIR